MRRIVFPVATSQNPHRSVAPGGDDHLAVRAPARVIDPVVVAPLVGEIGCVVERVGRQVELLAIDIQVPFGGQTPVLTTVRDLLSDDLVAGRLVGADRPELGLFGLTEGEIAPDVRRRDDGGGGKKNSDNRSTGLHGRIFVSLARRHVAVGAVQRMVATLADAPHWRNPQVGCPACPAAGITGNFARIVAIVREPRAGQKIRINDRGRSERTSSRGRHQSTRAIRNDRCWRFGHAEEFAAPIPTGR